MSRSTLAGNLVLARIWLAVLGGVAFALVGQAHASVADRYAAIVIDANSGRVLYSRNSDSYRYPASLTKMMTLYLTFEGLSAEKISLDDEITVSAHAAEQAPSKLGLKPGDQISVKEAVLALITKSANDAAVALGEYQGGSEDDFAKLMTRKAHELGMSNTTFENASGLPDPQQRTTARDLATLAQALYKDFPQYFGLFATQSFVWKGRTIPNHDMLLRDYPGTIGLKTGYTAASGFNLASCVERNGYDLIGVVLGGRTARARDQHMMRLLDLQFARLEGSPLLATRLPDTATVPVPQRRADVLMADSSAPSDITPFTAHLTSGVLLHPPAPVSEAAAMPRQKPSAPVVQAALATTVSGASVPAPQARPAAQGDHPGSASDPIGDTIAALTPRGAQADAKSDRSGLEVASLDSFGDISQGDADDDSDASDSRVIAWLSDNQHWGIQIGAFTAMASAAARLSAAAALAPRQLRAATPAIVSSSNGGMTVYKAQFGPFEEQQARAACDALSARGMSCVPVRDGEDLLP